MPSYNKVTIDDINVAGKRVLVRCDFNVPLKNGVITDENRINAALPTIQKLINDGGKVILCSHLRQAEKRPGREILSGSCRCPSERKKLGKPVVFAADPEVVGENAKKAVAEMKDGDVVLLENTRFRKEETKNLEPFSSELASLCDVYVNDAFGSAHRAHCSTAGVTDHIKENAVGYLMGKELTYLGNAVNDPVRPFVTILGGAKVADKLNVIENLLQKANTLIIGGGMAYTFLKAQGVPVGNSLVDDTKLDYCKDMLAKAEEKGVKILLPVDSVCAKAFPDPIDAEIETAVIPEKLVFLKAGWVWISVLPPLKCTQNEVKSAKTVVWNGPMAYLKTRSSQKAPSLLRSLWLRPTLPPSSAAATLLQLSIRWAMATR